MRVSVLIISTILAGDFVLGASFNVGKTRSSSFPYWPVQSDLEQLRRNLPGNFFWAYFYALKLSITHIDYNGALNKCCFMV